MTIVIGLTGGIASGKSMISNELKNIGIPVIDADLIARKVVEAGTDTLQEIVAVFGEEILNNNGTLNRKMLGMLIFNDQAKRMQLNNIIHPAIRRQMEEEKEQYIKKQENCVVMDIPLLFENELTYLVDKTIVVYVDPLTQQSRLINRDHLSVEDANARINSQMSLDEKKLLADAVINNNGTMKESINQLKVILKEWGIL